MARDHFYILVNLTDEVMGIGHGDMPYERDRSLVPKRYFSDLGLKFPIGIFSYRRGGIRADWFLSFGFPGGHHPQYPVFSKLLVPQQERLQRTLQDGRLLMTLLQFGLQWEQIVYLPVHYLLQSFMMVRLISSVTPKARKTLCNRFQLAFKTAIQFTMTKIFSRTCGSLTVMGIHMRLFFLFYGAQKIELLRWTQVLEPISGGTLQ